MATEKFQASVQYGDWKGTSAADNADNGDASAWLEANGHKEPGEILIGISIWAGENHGEHRDPISVTFLLASADGHDTIKAKIEAGSGPLPVKRVQVDMSVVEFFGLFKRLSVAFSLHGILAGQEYRYSE